MPRVIRRAESGEIGVLIVDDSAFMRHLIRQALSGDPRIRVVGEARNGMEAVAMNIELSPDVVLLDVHMPEMNGIQALEQMMAKKPVSIIMFSAATEEGAQVTLEALSLGAVDFLPKPQGKFNVAPVAEELCRKIVTAASARLRRSHTWPLGRETKRSSRVGAKNAELLVVVGSSTGGPQALDEVVPKLDASLPGCVLVCQHMPPGFTASMARRLDGMSSIPVKEAEEGDTLAHGAVFIAPGGAHLRIRKAGIGKNAGCCLEIDRGEAVHGVRPSVDVTLMDAGPLYKSNLLAVILTGMGSDGAKGAVEAKACGASVICQDEATSVIWGMPRSCLKQGACDKLVPLPEVADEITRFALGQEARLS